MRSFASVRFKSSNSEGFGRTRKTRRGAFQAPLASFSPEFYPRTLTYIYLCSNITEYLTVNAFEKTRNTSL